jgi:hypothetical protein
MPGRSGVTAPIKPDSLTTGTIAAPGRKRAGISSVNLSSSPGHLPRSLISSLMPFPQILIIFYPTAVINRMERVLHCLHGLQWYSGARNEDLSIDDADRYSFDSHSFYFSARTAIETAPAIASAAQSLSDRNSLKFSRRQYTPPGQDFLEPFIGQC